MHVGQTRNMWRQPVPWCLWPSLLFQIVASVNRVASLLKTRYSSPGPWSAGLRLFEAAQPLAVADVAFRKQLQGHVEAAQEVVGKLQEDESPAGEQCLPFSLLVQLQPVASLAERNF